MIHDTSLHYLAELIDRTMPGFLAAQLRAELPELASAFETLWRRTGQKRGVEHREIKLLSWLKSAPQVIVHSHYAARAIGSYFPHSKIEIIPHFAYETHASASQLAKRRLAARQRLKIDDNVFLLSTLGFVTANKQYGEILRAIGQLPAAARGRVKYIVAGEIRPGEYHIERAIGQSGIGDRVVLAGFCSEAEMEDVLLASDLVFNLRYPTFGESSGSVARGLGLGCALAVTDAGSYCELPDDVCFKLPAKPDPIREIARLIEASMEEAEKIAQRRDAAIHYARTALNPERIAARYAELVLQQGRFL